MSPGKLVKTGISGPYIRYMGHSLQSRDNKYKHKYLAGDSDALGVQPFI